MRDSRAFVMRLDGNQYIALPDVQRTAVVVGMVEMLEYTATRLTPDTRKLTDALRLHARQFESGQLRLLLDDYVNADASRLEHAIAGSFLDALNMAAGK